MKSRTLLFVIPLFMVTVAHAGNVDQTAVVSFKNGTPADAAQVNSTVQALINAINDNAKRIAALEASNGTSSSVAGRTYALKQLGVLNRGSTGGKFSTTGNLMQEYTLTFSNNGTFQLDGFVNEGELNITSNSITQFENNTPESLSGTYTQSGSTISTSIDVSLSVSLDGNVLVISTFDLGTEDDQPGVTRSESSILVGVRIK